MLRLQGEGSQIVLEQVRDMIRASLQYMLGFLIQEIITIISSLFGLVKDEISNISSGMASASVGLIEKLRTSFYGAVDFPEALNAFLQMIGEILKGLWKNCMDAVGYVAENAVN
ncbi:hypothetical protein F511_04779 [Dorcoceras hygrometricum]|uniref:Uncharacterized protein n=1 Tax=Dorcoceras hygrometricum TaxID=472368 RepID=A0A2Z7AWK2_9LAMI|nr:hypothetical protein F511_04779 [Dorcoceras hygrometricum]